MDKKTIAEIEKFLAKVPPESRDTYLSFIKAFYLHQKEMELNQEFLKKVLPLLTPPDRERSEEYTWDLMKSNNEK